MKYFYISILSTIILLFFAVPLRSYAENSDDICSEVIDELDDTLNEFDIGINYYDISKIEFSDLIELLWDRLYSRSTEPLHMLSMILLIVISSAVIRTSFGNKINDTSGGLFDLFSVICVGVLVTPKLVDVYIETLNEIEICGNFILVFVPIFTSVAIISGGIVSAGVYHLLILGASEMIIQLSESYFVPLLGTMIALSLMSCAFSDSSLDCVVGYLKKFSTWIITLVMTLFTGFVTLKCSIAGKADGVALKTTKVLISGVVPVIGGAVSDAYSTVKGSLEIIGSTVGAAGIIGIVVLMLPSILELFIYRGVMLIGASISDLFSANSMSKLFRSFDSGLAIAQCIQICYMLMFLISSAILAQTMGQG